MYHPRAADYPFPATPLAVDECALVARELAEAERAHSLLAPRPILLRMAAVFLKHCSPPAPAPDALALVTRLLRLVLYFNDRVDPARLAAEAPAAWQLVVRPDAPVSPALAGRPVLAAAADIGARLGEALGRRGVEATSFAHLFRVNLAAFAWVVRPAARPPTLREHLELRSETISAIAYLRIWNLLGGLDPATELRLGFGLQRLERLSALVQSLANDLRSVDRDQASGEPNAVLLTERERDCPRAAAAEWVRGEHDRALGELVAGLAALEAAAGPANPALGPALAFIGICTRGNAAAMDELSERYS